jgi:hypothetical protein
MNDFDPDAVIDAMAPLLGLPLAAADRAAIATHLRIARAMADTLAAHPLPDDAEPLPVFRP